MPKAVQEASRTVLEGLETALQERADSFSLDDILAGLGLKAGKAAWIEVTRRLSEIGREPWQWKYTDNVYHGRQKASQPFAQAIEVLRQQLTRRQPGAIAGAELMQVYAQPGQFPAGVVIPRTFTWAFCAEPSCATPFIQRNKNQRYCDPSCGDAHRAELRKTAKPEYRCPDCHHTFKNRFALSGHLAQCDLRE